MRRRIFISIAILIFAGAVSLIRLLPAKPRPGPWTLSDGSELSFAGVTYGKKHAMRYGNRIVDYLYPILPNTLREKFGCKVAALDTPPGGIVLWFWDKFNQNPPMNRQQSYELCVVDENGLESRQSDLPARIQNGPNGASILEGWMLNTFPHRSKQFKIRIYGRDNSTNAIAEFAIINRTRSRYPVWRTQSVPMTTKTNGLEIELAAFKTQTRETDATINITERRQPAGDWAVRGVTAISATGESLEAWVGGGSSLPVKNAPSAARWAFPVVFAGAFWPEEPAWKMRIEIWRGANFPAEELWTIKGISVPAEAQTHYLHFTTNIFGSEIAVRSITRGKEATPGLVTLQVSSPLASADRHLALVEVRDEKGKRIEFSETSSVVSNARSATSDWEKDDDYESQDVGDTKTLDVTLAYTKSVFVEFIAKPTVAKADTTK